MLITWDGTQSANQYLSPPISHLVLSHPSVGNQLLLAQHDDKPYEYYGTGQTQADGRSLLGSIRLKGNNWRKNVWECNFLAVAPQVELFEGLLSGQQNDLLPVVLTDRWFDGIVTSKNVWLQIDRQYLTLVAANSWFRLQFQCLEV